MRSRSSAFYQGQVPQSCKFTDDACLCTRSILQRCMGHGDGFSSHCSEYCRFLWICTVLGPTSPPRTQHHDHQHHWACLPFWYHNLARLRCPKTHWWLWRHRHSISSISLGLLLKAVALVSPHPVCQCRQACIIGSDFLQGALRTHPQTKLKFTCIPEGLGVPEYPKK